MTVIQEALPFFLLPRSARRSENRKSERRGRFLCEKKRSKDGKECKRSYSYDLNLASCYELD
jgi:hypothetical protein